MTAGGQRQSEWWRELEEAMAWHAGRHDTPLVIFNRYAQHAALRLGYDHIRAFLDAETCEIRKEVWTKRRVCGIARDHAKHSPRVESGPVILIQLNGVHKFIDGNNRANKWAAESTMGNADVLIVRYRGSLTPRPPGSFVPQSLRSRSAPASSP